MLIRSFLVLLQNFGLLYVNYFCNLQVQLLVKSTNQWQGLTPVSPLSLLDTIGLGLTWPQQSHQAPKNENKTQLNTLPYTLPLQQTWMESERENSQFWRNDSLCYVHFKCVIIQKVVKCIWFLLKSRRRFGGAQKDAGVGEEWTTS